jgi:hypothetical protein
MRERRTLTSGRHFFTTARSDKEERFFVQRINSRPDLLRLISQRRPLSRWDRLRPPTPQGFEAEERGSTAESLPFQDEGEGNTRVLSAPAVALCPAIQH